LREPRDADSGIEVALGFALGLGLHALQVLLLTVSTLACSLVSAVGIVCGFAFFLLPFIGLTQLIYIIPAIRWARARARTGMAKGIIIAAALTAILNTACWGGFLWIISQG
jgi:uncharacterized membrane protein